MFNTDDGYYFDDVNISSNILKLIKSDPLQRSYRLYIGENLDEFPTFVRKVDDKYYTWNYYEHSHITHWTYPFSVDGTVYHTKSVLKVLKNVFYLNPVTLESQGVENVKMNKFFSNGMSPITSKLLMTKLNRVSTNSLNPTINISTDYLNQMFVEGFDLELELPNEVKNANVVPLKVFVVNENVKKMIYSIDKSGIRVQDSLGIQGAKLKF